MILVTIGPDIWAGASYPNVLATFQVGRSEMVHYLHTQLPPIFGEGRGEKREAVPMIFLYSYALCTPRSHYTAFWPCYSFENRKPWELLCL